MLVTNNERLFCWRLFYYQELVCVYRMHCASVTLAQLQVYDLLLPINLWLYVPPLPKWRTSNILRNAFLDTFCNPSEWNQSPLSVFICSFRLKLTKKRCSSLCNPAAANDDAGISGTSTFSNLRNTFRERSCSDADIPHETVTETIANAIAYFFNAWLS